MNREDIIKLARDNRLRMGVQGSYFFIGFDDLGALLDAATATEREACARVAEWCIQNHIEQHTPEQIKARGNP